MCTLVILRRPEHDGWPLLMAANRDERAGRAAEPPGRHWDDRPEVVGGLDLEATGSWLGLNDHGVAAAILNRHGTLGAMVGKRSRGELVLDALDHADAAAASEALAEIEPSAYRPFNLIIADNRDAFWIKHADDGAIASYPLGTGISMITSGDLNDPHSARIRCYRPLFINASVPDPDKDNWSDWQLLLSSTVSETGLANDAMCIATDSDYGTRSSSLIGLPAAFTNLPKWQFAAGPPHRHDFQPVEI